MKKIILIIVTVIIVAGGIWFWFGAQNKLGGVIAVLARDGVVLEVVKGQTQVTLGEVVKTLNASASQEIDKGAKVAVLADSQANLIFSSGTIARLDQNTEVDLNDYASTDEKISIKLNLINGTLWSRVQRLLDLDSEYEVKTANTVAVVRGTVFNITFAAGKTELRVLDKEVAVSALDSKTGAVLAGGEAVVSAGKEILVDEADLPSLEKPLTAKPIPAEVLQASWFQENLNKDKKIDTAIKKATGDGGVSSAQVTKIVLPQVVSLNLKPVAKEEMRKLENKRVLLSPTISASASPTASISVSPSPQIKASIFPKAVKPLVSPAIVKLSVVSVAPASAPGNNYQYTKLTIKGTGFGSNAKAFLGNHALANVKIIDSATLEGTLGAGIAPGRYDILVVLGDQRAVLPAAFNVFVPKE